MKPYFLFFLSGGNDNLVNIWSDTGVKAHTFNEHQGAVKALAWCPWQQNLLATGGKIEHFNQMYALASFLSARQVAVLIARSSSGTRRLVHA